MNEITSALRLLFGRGSMVFLPLLLTACADSGPSPVDASASAPAAALELERGTIVTLFEWRWDDIGEECITVLGPAGYAAVQVSSPAENHIVQGRPWWERYQPVSYLLETRSGSREEFSAMVSRCADAGVAVYVDAVINHTADSDIDHEEFTMTGRGTGGSVFAPFDYPGLYSTEDFHHCGLTDNDDIWDFDDLTQLRECELVDLADLDSGGNHVQSVLASYLADLQSLGVAGIRIDAALHMAPEDIRAILDQAAFTGYVYQEVSQARHSAAYYGSGDVTDFEYGVALAQGVLSAELSALVSDPFWEDLNSHDGTALVFIENHDTQRHWENVLDYKDDLYGMAVAMMLAVPYGRPRVFSGYAFEDTFSGPPANQFEETSRVYGESGLGCGPEWICEHRWPLILGMVGFQKTSQEEGITRIQADGPDRVAFSRGDKGFVAFNRSNEPWELLQQTGLPGTNYCNVAGGGMRDDECAGGPIRVDAGMVSATVPPNSVIAIHTGAVLD